MGPNTTHRRTSSRVGRESLGVCDQEITIQQTPGSNPYRAASYTVAGGPLSLNFNELMLRPPRFGERDLVIDVQEWRPELEGSPHPIQVITDHKNLEYFMTS